MYKNPRYFSVLTPKAGNNLNVDQQVNRFFKNMVDQYNGTLHNAKNELLIHNNMKEAQNTYASEKNQTSPKKEHILCNSTDLKL